MPDSKCPDSLEQATISGMTADVYIYPCPVGDDPAKQVADTIKNVGSNKVGKYWIVIDNYQWKDQEFNRKFVQGLITALTKSGKEMGFQVNKYLHDTLFGHSFTDLSKYPLWNRDKDREPNCKPFIPFGGWKQPFWKQYDTDTMCWGVFLSSLCQSCLLYTSPSPRDLSTSRMPSSA
eukprot:TRINITY_DN5059_c0_g1_i1.p2 TRINITY_DN5059_c0_g1~~TRINITY_DN5059_c0_g1_i1.p2  ORF type:complete len:177 (+),score=18.00 TRINITY_DN5059_c0_g1_i1:366-896(+)